MPRSRSSLPAGSIVGLSLAEPMMIPTRGASTSMPSKASSTSGMVSGGSGSDSLVAAPRCGSRVSTAGRLAHPFRDSRGDVSAVLRAVEVDVLDALVCTRAGVLDRVAEAR